MLLFIGWLSFVSCSVLSFPTKSSPCDREDKSCLTSLAQVVYATAVQGSDVEVDPMFQTLIKTTLPTLEFTLMDTTIRGLKSCEIKEASISPDKTSLHIKMYCPRFDLDGQYEADGKIEGVPFQGKGGFTLGASDYIIYLDIKLKTSVKDGKRYTQVIGFNAEEELKGNLDFKLENLFNGNKELSEATHKFIKENPKFVTEFLQKPVFDANFMKLIKGFNESLKYVPVDGLIA